MVVVGSNLASCIFVFASARKGAWAGKVRRRSRERKLPAREQAGNGNQPGRKSIAWAMARGRPPARVALNKGMFFVLGKKLASLGACLVHRSRAGPRA
jgi:hypothetical protein